MITPRICILTETYYPVIGGGETQTHLIAEGLVAKGHGVIVLTRRSNASFKKTEQLGSITVQRLAPVGSGRLRKWGLVITCLPAMIKLRRQYDLIFISGFRILGLSGVAISKLLGKPCILKADSLGEMSGKYFKSGMEQLPMKGSWFPFKIFLRLRNWTLRRANGFVAISSEIATELINQDVNSAAIRMIPNSVDTRRFCPVSQQVKEQLRHKLNLPLKVKIVTFAGRLVSYKGLPSLLRVWREIQREQNNSMLLLVGSGGLDIHNCEAEMKAYVRENDMQESVTFTGAVDNVYQYLQASDIFVFPTENEAFGISLIEAMSCGLPVIATHIGGVKDILRHRQNGLVIEAGNFQHLYDALASLMTNYSVSVSLGAAARQTAKERYSAEIVNQQYSDLFLAFAV